MCPDTRLSEFGFRLTLFLRAQQTPRMQIHIARDGKQLGPFSLEEINRQLAAGALSLSDNAWYEGASGWAPLSTVPGVAGGASAGATIPAAAPSATVAPSTVSAPVAPTALAPAAPTEPLAIVSLVLSLAGLLGFCCALFLIAAVGGVICGHLALSKIKSTPGLQGYGLALSGVIVGYFALVWWVFYLLFFGGLAALGGIMDSMGK